jgi:acetyltransferase
MQEGIAPKNPLDVGIPSTMEVTAKWCVTVANDPNIDMVAWASPMPAKETAWGDVSPLRKILDATDKPMIGFGRIMHQVADHHIAAQRTAGFPFLQGQVATVRALNALWFYAQRKGRAPAALPPAPASDLTPANLEATLKKYGIAFPQSAIAKDTAEAVTVGTRIGFPVALKIQSTDILHKTEAGGVALNLKDAAAVQMAAEKLVASARKAQPNARIDGFLVQEMVSGIEAIVGARNDALYGPMLLIGAGGILVELAKDAALRMLPVNEADVCTMIDGLKLANLLAGFRGRPAVNRAALEKSALALGQFFLDHREKIADIEINPLMVREHGAVAVDVRVLWRSEGA